MQSYIHGKSIKFIRVCLERSSGNTLACDSGAHEQMNKISDSNYIFSTSKVLSCLSQHHDSGVVNQSTFSSSVSIWLYTVILMSLVMCWTWSLKEHHSFSWCHLKLLGGLKDLPLQKLYSIGLQLDECSITLSLIKSETSFLSDRRLTGL